MRGHPQLYHYICLRNETTRKLPPHVLACDISLAKAIADVFDTVCLFPRAKAAVVAFMESVCNYPDILCDEPRRSRKPSAFLYTTDHEIQYERLSVDVPAFLGIGLHGSATSNSRHSFLTAGSSK